MSFHEQSLANWSVMQLCEQNGILALPSICRYTVGILFRPHPLHFTSSDLRTTVILCFGSALQSPVSLSCIIWSDTTVVTIDSVNNRSEASAIHPIATDSSNIFVCGCRYPNSRPISKQSDSAAVNLLSTTHWGLGCDSRWGLGCDSRSNTNELSAR